MKNILFCFIFFSVISHPALTQIKGFSPVETDKILQEEFSSRLTQDNLISTEIGVIGDVVIPERYYLGPGDILSYQNLQTSITTQNLIITPEVSVLLPRIGEVSLKGLTLAEARSVIINAIKDKNPNALVYISLAKPRTIMITLTGNSSIQGTFTVPANFRVSTAINYLNQLRGNNISIYEQNKLSDIKFKQDFINQTMNNSGLPELNNFLRRNITVIHNNGTSSKIDIEEAIISNDMSFDPYVQHGDIINIPAEPEAYATITISGAVVRPVTLPFKSADNIEKLIKFGYGFTDDADLDNIKLYYSGVYYKTISVDKTSNKLISSNEQLQPGASIIVGKINSDIIKSGVVSVRGFVQNPGTYPISANKTLLSEVIEQAGGFSDEAYLPLAYILRPTREFINSLHPTWSIAENFKHTDLVMEDTSRFFMAVNYKKPVVSCDFEKVFIHKSPEDDIPLQDGDIIVVPSNPKSVYVFGQVNQPGYVSYESGKNMNWYIQKAGGYAINAEKSRARIIDGKTKVWKKGNNDVAVKAGDEIYVPQPPDNPPGLELQTYAIIASAITSLVFLMNFIIATFDLKK